MFRKILLVLIALAVSLFLVPATSAQALPPGHEGTMKKFTIDDHQVIGQSVGVDAGKIEVNYLAHFHYWPDGYIQPAHIKFYQTKHPILKGGKFPFQTAWVKYHIVFTSDKVLAGKQKPRVWDVKMYPEYYSQAFDMSAHINGYYAHNNPRMCISVKFDIAFSPDYGENMGCHRLTNWY